MRYEAQAKEELERAYGFEFLPEPWFVFWNQDGRRGLCQPDGLLIRVDLGLVVIIEIKLGHTIQAYNQLNNLYVPVVTRWLDDLAQGSQARWNVATCEICKWHTSGIVLPVPPKVRPNVALSRPGEYNIVVYNPRHPWKGDVRPAPSQAQRDSWRVRP